MESYFGYILEPPLDRFKDRAGRTLVYLCLAFLGMDLMCSPHSTINHAYADTNLAFVIALMLAVSSLVSGLASAFGKYQVEMVSVKLVSGAMAVLSIVAIAAGGLHGLAALFIALFGFTYVRSNALDNIRRRARAAVDAGRL